MCVGRVHTVPSHPSSPPDNRCQLTDVHITQDKENLLSMTKQSLSLFNPLPKSRDITLLTKVHIVKAIIFPVVIYGCESWIIKKAEHQRIDAFELWCSRRLLRVPWTAKSNKSILKEIKPEYSLEGLVLKLKLQYFGPLFQITD